MTNYEKAHLQWIYNRMIMAHGERVYSPHMRKFKDIINKIEETTAETITRQHEILMEREREHGTNPPPLPRTQNPGKLQFDEGQATIIFSNYPKCYDWVAQDNSGMVYIYKDKPERNTMPDAKEWLNPDCIKVGKYYPHKHGWENSRIPRR